MDSIHPRGNRQGYREMVSRYQRVLADHKSGLVKLDERTLAWIDGVLGPSINKSRQRKINKLHARALRKVEIVLQYPKKLQKYELLDMEPMPDVIQAIKPPAKHAPAYSIRNSQAVLAFKFRRRNG